MGPDISGAPGACPDEKHKRQRREIFPNGRIIGRKERKSMRRSDRLEAVIAAVRPTECMADIGTDHGFVPIELVLRGTAARAIAMDVRKGPLARAREHIAQAGLEDRIQTRLSDGLHELRPGEAETVVIAGMGGELTIRIIEAGRELWGSVGQWVLSPHAEVPGVREWLALHGFSIESERIVHEEDKFYFVMSVTGPEVLQAAGENGEKTGIRESEKSGKSGGRADDVCETAPGDDRIYRYGTCLIKRKDPVFLCYLREEERQLMALCTLLEHQKERSERAGLRLLEAQADLAYNRKIQNMTADPDSCEGGGNREED